jgi:hypothetical protein
MFYRLHKLYNPSLASDEPNTYMAAARYQRQLHYIQRKSSDLKRTTCTHEDGQLGRNM